MEPIYGYWEIKEYPSSTFSGNLSIIDSHISLNCYSDLESSMVLTMRNYFEYIVGQNSTKGPVTIFDAALKHNTSHLGPGLASFEFDIQDAILGTVISSKDNKRFRRVSFKITDLEEWLSLKLKFTSDFDKTKSEFNMHYKSKSEKDEYVLNGKTLRINKWSSMPIGQLLDTTLKVYANVTIEYDQPVSFTDLVTDLETFRKFYTFLNNRPAYPSHIYLMDNIGQADPNNQFEYFTKKYIREDKSKKSKEKLLKYSDVKNNLGNLYKSWENLYAKHTNFCNGFLKDYFVTPTDYQAIFMNLASIFDNYLQRTYGRRKELKVRLEKFYKDNSQMIDEVIHTYPKGSFTDDFMRFRNELAHGEAVPLSEELFELIIRLRCICSYIILINLGFSNQEGVQVLINFRKQNPKYLF